MPPTNWPFQMFTRAAIRAAPRSTTSTAARRGFQTTRAQFSSPYHYPEGPRTNIPFNTQSKWFPVGYWAFMATGFSAPFLIARMSRMLLCWWLQKYSLCLTVWQTYKPKN